MSLRVRLVRADQLGQAEIEAWRDLEDRAIEPNAYLSPYFILPALRHLNPDQVGLCALVELHGGGGASRRRLAGVAVFVRSGPTRALPLPHLIGYKSKHSFLGGMLLDAEAAEAALESLFDFLASGAGPCHGVMFHRLRIDGPVGAILRRLAHGRPLLVIDTEQRAAMVPKEGSATYLAQQSGPRMKSFRRRLRRLAEHGPVGWAAHRSPEHIDACIARHLDLEHLGWKGQNGTSLLSSASGTAFFREVFEAFGREGRALFTELSVGNSVVASTSNLVSGRSGFAFKLGWEPSLARLSPGTINEIHLVREGPRVCPDLDWFDSGAAPGSFMEELWLERYDVARVVVPLTPWARIALSAVDGLRWARRRAAALSAKWSPGPTPAAQADDAPTAGEDEDAR